MHKQADIWEEAGATAFYVSAHDNVPGTNGIHTLYHSRHHTRGAKKTNLRHVLTTNGHVQMCTRGTCADVQDDVSSLRVTIRVSSMLKGHWESRSILETVDQLSEAEELGKCTSSSGALGELLGRVSDHVHTELQELLRVIHAALKTDEVKEKMLEELGRVPGQEDYTKALRGAGMGEPHDMALVVGPREDGPSYYNILCDPGHQRNTYAIVPMHITQWLTNYVYTHGDPHGLQQRYNLLQVAPLPEDLTPTKLETILGLYDPRSEGAMGDLGKVLEATRQLLGSKDAPST